MTLSTSVRELATPREYMARHSRSFRFAAAFMKARDQQRLARVYAWCRFTDDIVDTAVAGRERVEAQLDEWLEVSRAAYDGHSSGIPLVDRVMAEAAEAGVPFDYASDLVAGVRSDLHFVRFDSMAELQQYTYRVAGVVGRWLTQLFGVHDRWALSRAERLGHAMQLTNIVRDVGEDWDRGRLYIPRPLLYKHGLAPNDIGLLRNRPNGLLGVGSCTAASKHCHMHRLERAYRALMEELMAIADRDYAAAREAMDTLPASFRRAVAVSAAVYRGIHDEVRKNGCDNLTRRAATSLPRKLCLSARALLSLGMALPHGQRRPLADSH